MVTIGGRCCFIVLLLLLVQLTCIGGAHGGVIYLPLPEQLQVEFDGGGYCQVLSVFVTLLPRPPTNLGVVVIWAPE